ncbi:TPA: hypothetical protein RQJ57_003040 [Vibrio vulnificus]|nr:hypothetical protein [Vibrio vulnificus]
MRSLDLTRLQEIRRKKAIQQANRQPTQTSTSSTKPFSSPFEQANGIGPAQNDDAPSRDQTRETVETQITQIERQAELEKQKQKLLKEKTKSHYAELDKENLARKIEETRKRAAVAKAEAVSIESSAQKASNDGAWNSRVDRALRWLRVAFLTLLLLVLLFASALGLYYLYRMVTEEPIIKTVTETVTETVEKEVIPEECTQVRRNGKIYVSCDGVTVKGASTIAESGVDEIPELIE